MDQKIVYSKTGKGVLEIKNKAGKLSRDLAKVLTLVDGKSSVEDLIAKSKLTEANVGRFLKQLEDGGYIKEFTNMSGAMSSASSAGSSSYVDDLDFTSQLSPGKRIYSSSQAEMRARESADRERAEAEAKRKRDEAEQKKKAQAAQQAREEASRMARIEAERKAKEAAALKAKQQAELKAKQQAAEMEQTTRDLAKILEAERQALEKSSQKKKEEQARKAAQESQHSSQQDEERKRREEEERKRREEQERRRREEEERKRREEEERKRREEEEERKRRKEEEERRRREEEERKRREEEERRREEEEERKRREEEERRRREEEERKRREEEDRRRQEEDRRRQEEDRRREEEEDARRREEEDRRREEEDRYREEEEARHRQEEEAPAFDFGSFDLPDSAREDSDSASSFDLPELDSDSEAAGEISFDRPAAKSADSLTADFDRQQELLRKQEEEEERRRQEAEEARLAMERQRREEDARAEAERRAAMEAEMRARVEQEKAERAERERAKEEEYKRKIEQEEERKQADNTRKQQEELQRTEAERRQREEDLVRRRKEAEEADRKRAELKRLQKSGRIRSPMERLRPLFIGVVVIAVLLVGAIQLMPMSGYIPAVQKLASENIGEPVTIGSMQVSVLSGVQFKFSNVNIGATQDVTLTDVVVTPELGSLLGDKLVLTSIEADGGSVVKEALARMPAWLEQSVADPRVDVRAITVRGVKLDMRTFELPSFNADVVFRQNGSIDSATVATADGRLSVDIANRGGRTEVSIRANNWSPPFGAPVQLSDFSGTGIISGSTLRLSEWDATVYGGQAKGTAELSWGSRWSLSSQFEFARVETEEMLAAFSDTAKVTGSASGKASFLSRAGTVEGLLDRPSLQASFVVKKGTVDGVDLVRALQSGPGGTQGGATRFEELTGEVSVTNARFSYRNVELAAGILSAQSYFDIGSRQDVSGRVNVALRSPAQQLSNTLNVSGTLKGISLRP